MNRAEKRRQQRLTKKSRRLAPASGRPTGPGPDIQQALDLALRHLGAGELSEAEGIYQQILKTDPNQPIALHLLGVIAQQRGGNDIAVDLISRAIAIKPDFAEAHGNLGNALQSMGKLDEAVASYHKALAIKPDFADAHGNLGAALKKLERLDEAVESYQKALTVRPDDAEAHYTLGNMLKGLKRLDEAVESYQKALAVRPDFAEAHLNLGNAFRDLGRLNEAATSYDKAVAIKPDFAKAHSNLGNALQELGKPDEAVASYHKALAIKPDDADAHYNLGMAQLLLGDFQNGWENYNYRWLGDDFAPSYKNYNKPLWQGAAIDAKRLLVWKEQGVGESIIFASMIPDLIERGADIILECDKRLIPLFSRTFPAMTCVATDDPGIGRTADKKFDLHAPLGNAGRWLRADLASFPARPSYLVADGGRRVSLRNRYQEQGNDFLVGISWHSKGSNYGDQKSMTLLGLRPLLETPGITFIDLQYGDTCKERNAFTNETGIEVFHDDGVDQMADLDIFASQVAAMDIVVTISNTTAHMAGALGVPTLLMLGAVPIWYWLLEREDSPWYPSLRLFRQHESRDWQEVVERTRNELSARARDR